MTTYRVFDIKRFAIHDGDGIRTTIFLKGCPLRCQWCQNPEGLYAQKRPLYFEKKCIHCQRCQQSAYANQMIYKDRPYFHLDYSGNFDNLIHHCPTNAIQYDCQDYQLDELMEKIKDDEIFYRDNGGVTFSGGEPFLHQEALIEILKVCHQQHIHTAIETSLYTSLELIQKALPYLDLIYADLKIFNEKKHEEYTGVSSKIIKDNIQYLLKSEHKHKVIIRTPLIPTMTAIDENIVEIVDFLVSNDSEVHYELLNYNSLASSKYDLVDFIYGVDKKFKPFSKKEMQHFYDIVQNHGLKNLIKEGE